MLDLSNIWPEWKAVELIGEGSFGKVYKCVREEYGMKFESAVKVISIPSSKAEVESMSFEGLSDDEVKSYFNDIVADFSNEIKLMFMLKGASNIVSVENYKIVERESEVGWEIYILMEYLQSFVGYSKNKKFTEPEVRAFALDILNALEICSQYKIIHRDIKPDNIFVDRFGSFKLGDFGVAKQLESSMSMMSKKGTYSYMAPEVFRGEKYDYRADIYSLGMVMYKLLNRNKDPFIDHEKAVVTYKDRNEAIERRRRGEKIPAPIDASDEMAQIILRACEHDPKDRYLTISDFKSAVYKLDYEQAKKAPEEEKTTVVAVGDETEPMKGEDATLYADEATVLSPEDEPTVIDEPTMLDEPTAFAVDATVFDDGKEPTVMADDATVLDEPTMLDERTELDEPTVVDPDLTVAEKKPESNLSDVVDKVKTSQQSNEDEEEYNKKIRNNKNTVAFFVLAAVCIIIVLALIISAISTENGDSFNGTNPAQTELSAEEYYIEAEEALASGDNVKAAILYGKAGDYSAARSRSFELWDEVAVRETVSAGGNHTVGLKSDGTVVAVGYNDNGQCDVEDWTDIVAVSAGSLHTVGLKSDGTVVAVGYNNYGQCDVEDWTDIVAVSVGRAYTVGLKSDGTVVATEYIDDPSDYYVYYGQCDVEDWTDIVAVSAGGYHTVGLKSDGTVVAVGDNGYGQCDVDGWTDIVAVSAGYNHTVGLKSDGTVVAVGENYDGLCDVEDWTDIVAVSAGVSHTVGFKSDGTVVAVGDNYYGQRDVDDWTEIVAISAGNNYTVGLKSDGTVVATVYGDNPVTSYDDYKGQCDVDTWTDIKLPD